METQRSVKAPGELDLTFATDGYLSIPTAMIHGQSRWLADGKILTATPGGTSSSDIILHRHLENGEPDLSFGESGSLRLSIPVLFPLARVRLRILADGKALVYGHFGNAYRGFSYILRVLPDGQLDSSFGAQGLCLISLSKGSDSLSALDVQPDGKIVVVIMALESAHSQDNWLLRLDDGHLDPSFGQNGSGMVNIGRGYVHDLLVLPNGNLLMGGQSDGYTVIQLRRHLRNGRPDPEFGDNGLRTMAIDNADVVELNELMLQPDGSVLATGGAQTNGLNTLTFQLDPAGNLDTAFNNGEPRIVAFQGYQTVNLTAARQEDGKILTAGYSYGTAESHNFILMRMLPDGAMDMDFGVRGQVMTNFGCLDSCSALQVLEDGNILAFGTSDCSPEGERMLLARYIG